MRVAVIGAGVVGVVSAYLLARDGCQVTLLDRCGQAAQVGSFANGGQLSYSYVAPLAGPGLLPTLPRLMLERDSPLRFRPRLDPRQWRWCAQFLLACRQSVAAATTAQLLALAALSRRTLHALLASESLEFAHRRNGKLIVYRSVGPLAKARELVEYQAELGAEQKVLSASETLALEPALQTMADGLAGSVYTATDEVGDCHQFTRALLDRLGRSGNVTLDLGNPVRALERRGQRIAAVRTARGLVDVDAVVVAAGMGSRELLQPLGQDVPLYPLKGYSLTVPLAEGHAPVPAISVTDYERRVVYARLGDRLRIAAMLDLGGLDASVDPDRIALLKRHVRELFPRLDLKRATVWAGLRPATPTGRPLIGRSRQADNLWLNIGHGGLGFTLSCGSAALLAQMMTGATPALDPAPFRP